MKKVLVFIDWYLPGYKAGGPIRSMANMIHSLKKEYSFYVICLDTDYLDTFPYKNCKHNIWNKLSENEFVYYLSQKELSFGMIKKLIYSEKFDVLYINGVYSVYFSILPLHLARQLKFGKIIVAPRGMFSKQAFSAKSIKKKAFVALARLFGFYRNIIFHVTSVDEKSDIQSLNLKMQQIEMLPNFPPVYQQNRAKRIEKKPGELQLISIARISPEKNTLFSLQCLANYKYNGNIRFNLYGSVYNKAYWQECLELISKLPENIEVVYHGEINNNLVLSILQNNHFLFLPSIGENFGHSILESFISGRPVIISNTTPWKNLEKQNLGWDLDLNVDIFKEIIQKALDLEDNKYQILSERCMNFSKQICENEDLKANYKRIFE